MSKQNLIVFIVVILFNTSCTEQDILNVDGTGELADAQLYFPLPLVRAYFFYIFPHHWLYSSANEFSEIKVLDANILSRPEKSLHNLVNNPDTSLHLKINPEYALQILFLHYR